VFESGSARFANQREDLKSNQVEELK